MLPHANTTESLARRLPYVTVEGCIGVGKTTLTKLLAEALGARMVLEIVEENPFLVDFYKDKTAHAFKTQMFFLLSRFKQQEQLVQADLFEKNLVADYLFAKDRIFAELTLQPSELALYDQIFLALAQRTRRPDLVIYLHAPMELVLERIKRRGRAFEQSIDKGYLEDLVAAYGRFFSSYREAPLLFVDTTALNFPDRAQDFARLIDELSLFRTGDTQRRVLRGQSLDALLL